MATQDANAIYFSSAPQQESYKLIELPAELVELLESNAPPTITIKSAPSQTSTNEGYALLTANDTTYRVQQKNSSNPMMLLRPSSTSAFERTSGNEKMYHDDVPQPAVCAIATIADTVELYAIRDGHEVKAPAKINKWHERFSKSRSATKPGES